MKKTRGVHIKLCLVMILLSPAYIITAQEVSHRLESDSSVLKNQEYDKIFSYFIADKEEIKTLLKINAVEWGQLQPSARMEFMLTPATTLEPSIVLKASNWSFEDGLQYGLIGGFDYKVYYNKKRRERLGKSTNGFSANYFALGAYGIFTDYQKYIENLFNQQRVKHASPLIDDFYSGFNFELKYGLQRRIGNIGYVDVQAGAGYNVFNGFKGAPYPILRIGIGFGVTSKKVKEFIK